MVGFDLKIQNDIDESYLCKACSSILRVPYQLDCGHRQCQTCIEAVEGSIIKCPECQEETSKIRVLRDRGFQNDMKMVEIICSSCEWNGFLRDYEEHRHQEHPNLTCEFCKAEFTSTTALDEHKQNNCTKRYPIGASTAHDYSDLILVNNPSGDQLDAIYQSARSSSSIHTEQQTSDANNGRQIGMGRTIPGLLQASVNPNNNNAMQENRETINAITNAVERLNDDARRLNNESLRLQALIESTLHDLQSSQLSVEEDAASLNATQLNLEILKQELTEMQQTLEERCLATYDGTFIWKINDIRQKMGNAETGRQQSIFSPPFYSSKAGYKMRAQLYLNGDGNAQRTHLSLFFVLMRGNYDKLLQFPLRRTIVFCLYDQTPNKKHYFRSFRSDMYSDNFYQPQLDMNTGFGFSKFFPLPVILQKGNPYLRDDTIFIKIMVHFGHLSSTGLQCALNINPGLPTLVQQALIRQEIERRTQQQQSQEAPTSSENSSTDAPSSPASLSMTSSSDEMIDDIILRTSNDSGNQ